MEFSVHGRYSRGEIMTKLSLSRDTKKESRVFWTINPKSNANIFALLLLSKSRSSDLIAHVMDI